MTTAQALPKRSEIPTELTWNLSAIYPTDAAWEADFARIAARLPEVAAFQGKLGESAQSLLAAFTTRDAIGETLGKLYAYAYMRLHEDTTNSATQALADRVTTLESEFSSAVAYMRPEMLAIPQERLDSFAASEPGLAVYRHQLDEITRERAHVLSAEMESLLAQASEVGTAAERIYDMLSDADLKLPTIRDEQGHDVQLSQGNYLSRFLENQNRDVRSAAFEAMLGTYNKYRNTFAATLSAQVKKDIFFARAHKYSSALEAALDPNNIPVSVYNNLISTVDANLSLLHRYLRIRKRVMGLDTLHMYDLYTPLAREIEYKIPFEQAQERVAEALAPLGPDYVQPLTQGFRSRWIDVMENQGKRSGAYSWGSYGTQPYVLLNYQESMDSMFTLAHEMGHSMHSYFTWRTQPYPYGNYTLFVAEVASTLNEALLTQHLLRTTDDRALKLYVVNHALETFRGTLYRQTMFAEFEREIHAKAEAGEALTPESLCAFYKGINDKYYGAEVAVGDLIEIEWARIPHFYSSFYVYQYATGISASSALASQILTEGEPAVRRYKRFLSSGSSDYSINLLRDAGVDLATPQPIQAALDTFGRYLDELESLL
ncbi:MAG TPA: oligoendopeptidase F [Ktedonobacterales bacterium]|nr:oligoendopeptidase F [Ktedonobacterales bacterium]